MQYALALTLALALIMDYLYPRHSGVLYLTHPVHLTYVIAANMHRPYSGRVRGVAVWFASVAPVLAAYIAPIIILLKVDEGLASTIILIIYSAYVVKLSLSLKLLIDIVREYVAHVKLGDWNGARAVAQQIVRRNVWVLDEGHVNSAVVESLFESIVDGFTSPLMYLLLLGPPGALLQRLANTMDSALGYRDPEYLREGWFSARVDTALNYLPARLTSLMLIALSRRRGLGMVLKASSVDSVNARWVFSAASVALGIVLEKPGEYRVGSGELPSIGDVERSIRLAEALAMLSIAISIALASIIGNPLGILGILLNNAR